MGYAYVSLDLGALTPIFLSWRSVVSLGWDSAKKKMAIRRATQ